jgi:hypothetical protein
MPPCSVRGEGILLRLPRHDWLAGRPFPSEKPPGDATPSTPVLLWSSLHRSIALQMLMEAVAAQGRMHLNGSRGRIPAIAILLLVAACAERDSHGGDGGGTPDGPDTAVATVCNGRTPASIWAMWKMPNPAAAKLANPASYTDLGDGTVRDDVTCLVWQREVSGDTYAWADANGYCSSLSLAGGGWRLPSRIELVSLVDFTKAAPGPTIDTIAFPNTPAEQFWSSSMVAVTAGGMSFAWYVYFLTGATADYELFIKSRVRCVR